MILFLDFDGVLHPCDHGGDVFSRVAHLWEILRACPGVRVVFSTSWRESFPLDELVDMATANGGEDLAPRFIGTTGPFLDLRQAECLAWLESNGLKGQPWIAIDDRPDWFPDGNIHAVDSTTGLTADDVPRVIEKLR